MYTSNSDLDAQNRLKSARRYLVAALLCGFFGAIYERFSHEVYSCFMLYAFVFPLAGGALPCLLPIVRRPCAMAGSLWGAGIATLTVGSLFRGALEIYGTTSPLTRYYWIVGAALLLIAALLEWTRGHGLLAKNRNGLSSRSSKAY